jgi:rod shape determining protein RodA
MVKAYERQSSLFTRLARYDFAIIATALGIGAFGVIMVYSATRGKLIAAGIDPHYYLDRQGIFYVFGAVAMIVVALIDYQRFSHYGYFIYGATILALLAVLTPIGSSALGSQRWFQLGPLQIQPSEFAPIGVIFGLSSFVESVDSEIGLRELLIMLAMGGVPMILVIKQPDLGTGIVIGIVTATMLVMAGVPGRYLLVLTILGVFGIVGVVHFGLLKHYQVERLLAFLNPSSQLQSSGYNLAQSKIAVGSGHIFGTGLFKGSQTNLAYVPEQQTDFIFTAVGEQLGFVGSSVLLFAYAILVYRIWRIMRWTGPVAGRLIVAGALGWIGYSVFQNVGMTIGIMPITGIPLPLVSYGGSALLAFFVMIGLVLNVGSQRSRVGT